MAKHVVLCTGTKALWRSVNCARSELRLDLTLGCGQTFRWRETGDGHWTGVMGGRVWTLTQNDHMLWYHVYKNHQDQQAGRPKERAGRKRKATDPLREPITNPDPKPEPITNPDPKPERIRNPDPKPEPITSEEKFRVKEEENTVKVEEDGEVEEEEVSLLKDYFQLDVKLEDLYREWRTSDPHFRSIGDIFTGVRMLRQDPTECLFSFICTSNNHISRIQGMVERLCQALGGAALATLDGYSYYDFPKLEALAGPEVEQRLRDLGFGYRAGFLQKSAQNILQLHGGAQWLHKLRDVPYLQARDALRTLPGVGVKVSDCVCLMSLDKADAVPVDTHVWQIAKRDYKYSGGGKTLTPSVHTEIGHFFRQLWGPYAGWAHSVLFCADLKKFQKMKESVSVKQEEETDLKKFQKMKESVSVKQEEETDLKKFQKMKESVSVKQEEETDLKKFQKMKESVSVKQEEETGKTIQKNIKREDKKTVKMKKSA